VKSILIPDPLERPTISDIKQHPWIQHCDSEPTPLPPTIPLPPTYHAATTIVGHYELRDTLGEGRFHK
jgi:serine/threonine protein kinase